MATGFIEYREGYKYQLYTDYKMQTSIQPTQDIKTAFIDLAKNGELTVKKGYAWDGPSFIADTPENMRASLVHDALYQLMRGQYLNHKQHRKAADKLFKKLRLEDGDDPVLVRLHQWFLREFGEPNALPAARRRIHRAPPA